MLHLILFGPPGSGKGTQAKKLAKKYNFVHISTGDLFRSEIGNKTKLGQKAKEYLGKGILVPDEITIGMLRNRVEQESTASGIIYDGFPRTVKQAEALHDLLGERNETVNVIIILQVSDREIINRILERAKTSGRSDDADEAIIRNRIDVYREETLPVLNFYEEKEISHSVDGLGSIEEIFDRLCKVVHKMV